MMLIFTIPGKLITWFHFFRDFRLVSVSVTFAGPATWNQLPENLRECGSFFVFKRRLKQILYMVYYFYIYGLLFFIILFIMAASCVS